jgi:hypothetical protein
VSEYTSFLVLENDKEFKRWKIERRNLRRMGRDRKAQAGRREELDAIRNKAVADLGPQPEAEEPKRQAQPAQTQTASRQGAPRPAAGSPSGSGMDISFGTGPVGPVFIALLALLAGRKKRSCSS